MINNRIIPVLLLSGEGLVKTIRFSKRIYVGDPLNAIKIFNEKEVDELVILDIEASTKKQKPNISYIKKLASECFMPLCYGGGITNIEEIEQIFFAGVEKISINTALADNPDLISRASEKYGSQSILGSIDIDKNIFGKYQVFVQSGKKKLKESPVEWAKKLESAGAGEIFMNSIHKDGTMEGFDIDLIKEISGSVKIPVIASGGAGNLDHCKAAIEQGKASAVGVGSMVVFKDSNRAVLISYPNQEELKFFRNE